MLIKPAIDKKPSRRPEQRRKNVENPSPSSITFSLSPALYPLRKNASIKGDKGQDSPLGTAPTTPAGRRSRWPCCPNNVILPLCLSPRRHPVTASLRHSCTPSGLSLSLPPASVLLGPTVTTTTNSRCTRLRRDTMRRATCGTFNALSIVVERE